MSLTDDRLGWPIPSMRTSRRAAGAPFTVIWNGERMPGTEDGQAPFAGATIGAA